MRLKLKNTPEQVELIKAMGSKNQLVAREASEAFAAFLGPVVQKVLQQAATAGAIYTDAPFSQDEGASYPLDLYYNETNDNYISTFSQNVAGGLPTSQDVSAIQELKIATYRLDSAVSITKKYARQARLDVVSKLIERMSQEVLLKQERNAWAVALYALANASTSHVTASSVGITSLAAGSHVIPAHLDGRFQLQDLNKLMTLNKRINQSWAAGTADGSYSAGVTDLYVSPEIKEQIRAFAYQPMNTKGAGQATPRTDIALPDNIRTDIFNAAGMQEIYGVNIVELNELGDGQKYNTLFDEFDSGNIAPSSTAGTAEAFATGDNDQLLVGIDNSKGAFVRAVAQDSDTGDTFTTLPDDQFTQRNERMGFYGSLEEGRVCIDARAIVGLVV
ncbi:MAG TPA: hypothetical protein EYG21_07200 [Nitrospinaceae bacterium]|jgi:hypothetical protein|nr:hypothetical protein [Nitrospinaceae bacterium]